METRTFDCWEFPGYAEEEIANSIEDKILESVVYASLKEIRESGFRMDGEPEKFKVTITVENDNDYE